jgi:hypothetical protein
VSEEGVGQQEFDGFGDGAVVDADQGLEGGVEKAHAEDGEEHFEGGAEDVDFAAGDVVPGGGLFGDLVVVAFELEEEIDVEGEAGDADVREDLLPGFFALNILAPHWVSR